MKRVKIAAVIMAILCALSVVVIAAYDSSEDPLVSLSYLNDIFKYEILSIVDQRIDNAKLDIKTELAGTVVQPQDTADTSEAQQPEKYYGYEVLELHDGDEVYAITPCDIMLRAGTAVCIAPNPSQGISDYTDAVELLNGMAFTKNHMCLIPRGDGRGLRATSESVFIEIRGEYTVVTKQ
ncbi:MAG: hypothetical protein IJU57_02930 [Clostridia bacterium]|nr:hypothetical protein [Clostridia bacterium]